MSADVIPLNRAEPEGSIEPMLALTAQGMNRVNQVILDRMQSEVPVSYTHLTLPTILRV